MKIREKIKSIFSGSTNTSNNLMTNQQFITQLGGINWYLKNGSSKVNVVLESIYHKIANDVSATTVKHIIKHDAKDWEISKTSDLAYVCGFKPNRLQTQCDLFYCIGYSLAKYDNAILVPVYKTDAVSKLEIESLKFVPVTSELKIKDNKIHLSIDDEILVRNVDDLIIIRNRPYSLFENISLDLSGYTKLLDIYAASLIKELEGNGKIQGLIKLGAMVKPEERQGEIDKMIKQFETSNSAGLLGIDQGMEFTELRAGISGVNVDAQKDIKNEIYKVFGLNESIFTADASEQQSIAYYNSTLEPLLKRIKQSFSSTLIDRRLFEEGHRLSMILPKFDNASLASYTDYAYKSTYLGITTVNEIRDDLNMSPVEGGDIPRTNLNAVSLIENDNTKKGVSE